eukprot:gene19076-biopygen19338
MEAGTNAGSLTYTCRASMHACGMFCASNALRSFIHPVMFAIIFFDADQSRAFIGGIFFGSAVSTMTDAATSSTSDGGFASALSSVKSSFRKLFSAARASSTIGEAA